MLETMTIVKLELDDDVVAELRAEAERTGASIDQVAARRLRASTGSVIDQLWSRNDVDHDEGMALANDEVRAMRAERAAAQESA